MSDCNVKVSGMMHLLSDHIEGKDRLIQTLQQVYQNFTSIHKAAIALLDNLLTKFPEQEIYAELREQIGFLITFCRCSLLWIFKEVGITVRERFTDFIAEIEFELVDCTNQLSVSDDISGLVLFYEMEGMMTWISEAYYESSSICEQLINYELITEFIDQLLDDLDILIEDKYIENLKEMFTVLRKYLKFLAKARINGDDLKRLMIAVMTAAYEMARCSFFSIMRRRTYLHRIKDMYPSISMGVFKALALKLDASGRAPRMSGELLMGYVKCVQEKILELLEDKAHIDLTSPVKIQLKVLHDALSFLMHLIIRYLPKQSKRVSGAWLHLQDWAREVGFFIYSGFDNPKKGDMMTLEEMSPGICDLLETFYRVKDKIIMAIRFLVLKRAWQESPKTDQLGFLILVLKKLKKRKPDLLTTWNEHDNLVLFIFYLQNANDGSENIDQVLDYCKEDEHIKFLTEKLNNLQINHEEVNGLLISAQAVASKVACYSLLRRYGEICWWELYFVTKDRVDLHMRVSILKALVLSSTTTHVNNKLLIAFMSCIQDSLTELQIINASKKIFSQEDQFEILHDGLLFLVRLHISFEDDEQEQLSHIKARIQDLMRSVGSAICTHFSILVQGDMVLQQGTTELSNLVEKLNLIKVEIKEFLPLQILNTIGLESPKTDQLGSLNFLLGNWKGLMESESDLINTWKDQFQMIHENFVLFRTFIISSSSEDDASQNICNCIMDARYAAEYLLTSFADGACPVQCTSLWMSQLTNNIELIKSRVMEAAKMKNIGNSNEVNSAIKDLSSVSSQTLLVPALSDVVGFDEETELMKEHLLSDFKQIDVVSITGMPGLGKTTLTKKVYEDPLCAAHFEIRAWCCLSQDYNKKDIFLAILGSVIKVNDLTKRKSDVDLSVMVHQELKGRRYLIVLDDIWDIDIFTELVLFFPDDSNGSRIMLTSRSKVIGLEVKRHSDPIEPKMLTDEESWDLLEHKVYNKGKCPSDLCQIGREVAQKCRGLPLAVVVVGGLLKKSAQKRDLWEQVAGDLSSYLVRNSKSPFMAALELSYKFLPDSLKPMFLYLGAFPEDMEIPTDKLIWLWIAEGFVHKSDEVRSLEIQAEINLMDLIDRSLVMVARNRTDGRVKACHVHDLLRDMCLVKAKEEKFMQQLHVSNELPDPIMYQRRLSIYLEEHNETTSRHLIACHDLPTLSIIPPIYSLLFFYKHGPLVRNLDLKSVFSSLKLLKVLHVEHIPIYNENLLEDLIMLVGLRYMSILLSSKSIPSSISRLRSLETLIINAFPYAITVPESIWELTKLRHLHIHTGKFSVASESPSTLENLESLSMPLMDLGEEEKLFMKVLGLKKLMCGFEEGIFHFPNFTSLGKLESLRVSYFGAKKCTGQFQLPSTLKKLSISWFCLEGSAISMFQELKNLEVLMLYSTAVEDEFWDVGDGDEFTNLKLLSLKRLNIKRWSACAQNFPSLEKVVLESCEQLEEIPSDLGEFYALQKIEVLRCSLEVVKIAKNIQIEQDENGNDILKVYIYPPPEVDSSE